MGLVKVSLVVLVSHITNNERFPYVQWYAQIRISLPFESQVGPSKSSIYREGPRVRLCHSMKGPLVKRKDT
jgi:hypothetical protein